MLKTKYKRTVFKYAIDKHSTRRRMLKKNIIQTYILLGAGRKNSIESYQGRLPPMLCSEEITSLILKKNVKTVRVAAKTKM